MKPYEWQYLGDLLENGYPIMDALTLLGVDDQFLKTKLEKGEDLYHILCQEDSSTYMKHLRFFLSMMSFPQAIESALSLSGFEKNIKMKLIKKSTYPVLIFMMAYVLLWFFTSAIIPQMMSSFASDSSFQSLSLMVSLIQFFCTLVAFAIFILLVLLLYLHFHKELRSELFTKMKKRALLKDYESYLFSGYLCEMEKHGISTKECMHFFSNIEKGSVFQKMVESMRKQLEMGKDFQETIEQDPFLNKNFKLSFRIGCASNTLETILNGFMVQQERLWDQKIKKISALVQCVSYSFVGFVVILVYQIMLVPLQMLEQM